MNQDEVESQLSAMLDGELPAAECELLSRRIDRDEGLRVRWSHYALIGAALRFEPVATARSNFAARVSSALKQEATYGAAAAPAGTAARPAGNGRRTRRLWWQAALAAGLVGAVAGLSITMLRNVALGTTQMTSRLGTLVSGVDSTGNVSGGQAVGTILSAPAPVASGARAAANPEPWSYVTPWDEGGTSNPLRTELVDYIVAHSEYSTPLMRPDLLSELVSGEDEVDSASSVAGTDSTPPGAGAPVSAGADEIDATPIPASVSGR